MARRFTLPKLVVATHNRGKAGEIRGMLGRFGVEVVSAADLGLPSPPETGTTFEQNAIIKALAAARASGLPALADDSGLCVRALDGAPGVQSARYAGEPRSDARNNAKLVAALAGVGDRRAHYTCVLALLRSADDPEPIVAEGRWHGTIVDAPRGSGGFGYDPHFLDASTGMTGAELPLDRKNEISHRGRAIRALIARLTDES